jgi:MoxR-like ATPase
MTDDPASHEPATDALGDAAEVRARILAVRGEVAKVIVGQDAAVSGLVGALLVGGHVLIEGVPGVAKTLLASVLSKALDLEFSRVQFTIDLLPSDIVGSEILDQRTNEFRTHRGPIFTNLLLADEINRAAPKVQSALLEAMQERKVTIGNTTYTLPAPFLVVATQNPVEQSGTFELPEAQLDRFMLLHRLEYPTPDEEREILRRNASLGVARKEKGAIVQTEFDVIDETPVGATEEIVSAMEAVHRVHVSDTYLEHVVELVTRTRNHPAIELGGSPRAGIALIKASRARALIHGRDYVIPEDLFALAEGLDGATVLEEMLRDLGATPAATPATSGEAVHATEGA